MHVDVQIEDGALRGARRANHQAFLGVPYAAPPLGPLRFAAPQPVKPWNGTRDAQQFGASAPQAERSTIVVPGPQSEDCLFLNVFTPQADTRKRPVLFWIHGGGFTVGSTSQLIYDGGALCERGDVVVVTINYRLGALGYLYLGGHGGESFGAASNAGQLDQIAALRWVRDNIARFGGDPEQVTIFGESAGSVAVCALLAMPAAKGLFVRAIGQSGTANRLGNPDSGTSVAQAFLQQLGLTSADPSQLRSLPLKAILAAQSGAGTTVGMFAPIVDGTSLPERPLVAVRDGVAREIPLLLGTNRDEAKFYIDPKRGELDDAALERRVRAVLPHKAREQAPAVIARFRESRLQRGLPHTNNDMLDAIDTASRFRIPATRLAEAQVKHQPQTYLYLFDWESPSQHGALGSCHALELSFVFGTLGAAGNERFTGTGPDASRLSAQMMDAWLAFAKTGDPSCDAIGQWTPHDATTRQTMIFGKNTHLESAPFEEERALFAELL